MLCAFVRFQENIAYLNLLTAVTYSKFWKKIKGTRIKNQNPCHAFPAGLQICMGSLQRYPDPLAGLRGLYSKGRGREGRGEKRGEEGRRIEGRVGRGGEWKVASPLSQVSGSALE